MKDNESRKWLYDKLTKEGLNVGKDYAEFDNLMQNNEESRKWAYEKAGQLGYNVGRDYEEFNSLINPHDEATSLAKGSEELNANLTAAPVSVDLSHVQVPTHEKVNHLVANPVSAPIPTAPGSKEKQLEPTKEQNQEWANWAKTATAQNKDSNEAFREFANDRQKDFSVSSAMGIPTRQYKLNPQSGEMEVVYKTSAGNEYTSKALANDEEYRIHKAENFDPRETTANQVASLSAAVDEELAAAKGEAIEQSTDRIEKARDKGVMDLLGEMTLQNGGGMSPTESVMSSHNYMQNSEGVPTKEGKELNLKIRNLESARNSLDNAENIINEANINAKKGTFTDWLKRSFAGGAVRGLSKTFDVDTWDFGKSDISEGSAMLTALKKADKGEKLTPSEERMLDAKAIELATNAYFGSEVGYGYKAGSVTAESLPFMLEFLINPMGKTGKTAASMLTRYAIKKWGKEAVKKSGRSFVASKVGTRLLGHALGAAGMNVTTGMSEVMGEGLQRAAGNAKYKINDYSEFDYGGQENRKDIDQALKEGFVARGIENMSEMVGEEFAPFTGMLGGLARKGLDKVGLGKVNKWIDDFTANDYVKAINEFEKQAQWSGVVGETAEEYVGGILNALTVGDQTLDTDEQTGVFSKDNFIETFLGVGLFGGFVSTMKTAGYRTPKFEAKKKMSKAEQNASELLNNTPEWNSMRTTLAVGNDYEIERVLKDVLSNSSYTPQQKQAIYDYANSAQYYRGVLRGQEKKIEESEQQSIAKAESSAYDQGCNTTDPQAMNGVGIRYNEAKQAVADVIREDEDMDSFMANIYPTLDADTRERVNTYVKAKAQYDGMLDRVWDDVSTQIEESDRLVDARTHGVPTTDESGKRSLEKDGTIIPITHKSQKKMYVTAGNVVANEDGTINRELSDKSLVVVDENGNQDMISPGDVIMVDDTINADEEKAHAKKTIMDEGFNAASRKIDGTIDLQPNSSYMGLDMNGTPVTITILGQDEQGNVVTSIMGQQMPGMPIQQVQAMVDAYNHQRAFEENTDEPSEGDFEGEAAQEAVNANAEETTNGVPNSYLDGKESFFIDVDGQPHEVTITGRADGDKYVLNSDEGVLPTPDGASKNYPYTLEEISNMMHKEQPTAEEQPSNSIILDLDGKAVEGRIVKQTDKDGRVQYFTQFTDPRYDNKLMSVPSSQEDLSMIKNIEDIPEINSTSTEGDTAAQTDESAQMGAVNQSSAAGTALSRIPKDAKGNPIYEQTDSDTAWDAIVEQSDGDEAMAQSIADSMLADKEAELKRVEKLKLRTSSSVAGKIAAEKEHKAIVQKAQSDVDIWRKIAGTANQRKGNVPEQNVPKKVLPRDKDNELLYEQVPVADTIEEIYTYIDKADTNSANLFINNKLSEAEKNLEKLEKSEPQIGTNLHKHGNALTEWQKKKEEAQKKIDYWKAVKAENDRITNAPVQNTEVVADDAADVSTPQSVNEYVASLLGTSFKITPESFKHELNYNGKDEQKSMVGVLATKEKGGLTIPEVAEKIMEKGELQQYGFQGTDAEVRDAIIEVLQDGNPRGYIKRRRNELKSATVDQEQQELDNFANEVYHMSGQDYLDYEENVIPSFIQKYKGFDETDYYNLIAEEENGKQESNDSEGEVAVHVQGREILQGEEPSDNEGETSSQITGQGSNLHADNALHHQNGEISGDTRNGGIEGQEGSNVGQDGEGEHKEGSQAAMEVGRVLTSSKDNAAGDNPNNLTPTGKNSEGVDTNQRTTAKKSETDGNPDNATASANTEEGKPIVKDGTIFHNKLAEGNPDAVAMVVGSGMENGKRQYIVRYATSREDLNAGVALGEKTVSEEELKKKIDGEELTLTDGHESSVQYSVGNDIHPQQSKAEQLTTQAVLTALDKANVPVVVVSGDMVNDMLPHFKGDVEMMGHRLDNRKKEILRLTEGRKLSSVQQSLIDVYADKKNNVNITLEDKSGRNRQIKLRKGKDISLGVEHSLYRHYDTHEGVITVDDILDIPFIVKNGERTEKEEIRLKKGKEEKIVRVNYTYEKDGLIRTLVTELDGKKESFCDFYSNKKGNKDLEQKFIPSKNTDESAPGVSISNSEAKIDNNSETDNGISKLSTSDGVVYGWTDGKTIYLNQDFINPETPIHEYTHLWAKAMMLHNQDGWKSVKELLRDTPIWNEVVNDSFYANIRDNEDEVASEVLSRISGKQNAARLEAEAKKVLEGKGDVFEKAEAISLIERMKEALQKFWNWVGKELFNIKKFDSVEQVTDRVLYDLVNGTKLGDTVDGKSRFHFIGVKGAYNLDRAEEASHRLDSYDVARKMEENDEDALDIKMATGWERGADGKWRYEIHDFDQFDSLGNLEWKSRHPEIGRYMELNIKNNSAFLFGKEPLTEEEQKELADVTKKVHQYDLSKLQKNIENLKLSDFVQDEDLFRAYPYLKQTMVDFADLGDTRGMVRTLPLGVKMIVLNRSLYEEANGMSVAARNTMESTLVHEVQHIIQAEEGFAPGGNLSVGDDIYDKFQAWAWRNELVETRKEHPGVTEAEVEDIAIKEYKANGIEDWLPKEDIRIKGFNLFARGYDNEGYEDAFNTVSEHSGLFLNDKSRARDVYRSLGGEVEARNAQSRMYMDMEERRETLAEETEDVSRKDQIFLENSLDGYSMDSEAKENPSEQKTFVGVHNIREDKLRKALQLGGLANPSVAVIDSSKQQHEDFGDISLILPSSSIDGERTYTGDAWTPTYPTIIYEVPEKGYKKMNDRIDKYVEDKELNRLARLAFRNYIEDNSTPDLKFMFLREKGVDIPVETKKYKSMDITYDELLDMLHIEDKNVSMNNFDDSIKIREAYDALPHDEKVEFNKWMRANGSKRTRDRVEQKWDTLSAFRRNIMNPERAAGETEFNSFMNGAMMSGKDTGETDTYAVDDAVRAYFNENDLYEEYYKWVDSLKDYAGAKGRIYVAYNENGRVTLPYTLKNVSKVMNKESRVNAGNSFSMGAARTPFLKSMKSLDEIRAYKDRLSSEGYNEEEYENWSKTLFGLASELAQSSPALNNSMTGVDSAGKQIQEALPTKDPVAYLNKTYKHNIKKDSDFAKTLFDLRDYLKNLPSKYFETKFERPVMFNEFSAAVVPSTTDEEIKQTLKENGLKVVEYDEKVEGSRKAAFNEAVQDDGIRFRKRQNRVSERRKEKDEINKVIDEATSFLTGKDIKTVRNERIAKEIERKRFTKKIYEIVLSHDFKSANLQQIKKFIEDVTPRNPYGRHLSQRIPQGVERSMYERERKGVFIETLFSRIYESTIPANERSSESGRRTIEERKKEALKAWAIATGNWHTNLSDFTDDLTPIGHGSDSDVYASKDGASVIKTSKGKPYGKRFHPDIDQIALFNHVFPNTSYEILGYGEINGQFVKILKQPFVDFSTSYPLTQDERVAYMHSLGFEPLNDNKTAFSNGEIIASDLQKSNIVKDKQGNIRVIDADMKLHTNDVGGKYSYPPVEQDTLESLDIPKKMDTDAFRNSGVSRVVPIESSEEGYYAEDMSGTYRSVEDLLDAYRNRHQDEQVRMGEDGASFIVSESTPSNRKPTPAEKQKAETFVKREIERAKKKVQELAEKLGVNVRIVEDVNELEGDYKQAKGWYDVNTKQVVVVIPNNASVSDCVMSMLHEAVGHHGLRQLFGKHFDTFLDNVYDYADDSIKQRIDAFAKREGLSRRVATEEYLASLAEDTNFRDPMNTTWWGKIKKFFLEMLAKVGVRFNAILTDNELRYILWRSYDNLANPNYHTNVFAVAEDVAKQYNLKVGKYAEDLETPLGAAEHINEVAGSYNMSSYPSSYNDDVLKVAKLPADTEVEIIIYDGPDSLDHGDTIADLPEYISENKTPLGVGKVRISKKSIRKIINQLSDLPEYIKSDYIKTIKKIEDVIEKSLLLEEHRDRMKSSDGNRYPENPSDPNILKVQRLYGSIKINDKYYRVKTTVRVFKNENGQRLHGYDIAKIELLAPQPYTQHDSSESKTTTNNSITLANLLNGVELSYEPGVKLLEAMEKTNKNVRFRKKNVKPTGEAAQEYNPAVRTPNKGGTVKSTENLGFRLQEAYQDSMLSLKKLQEAIENETGRKIQDFENAYMAENRMSSVNKAEAEEYKRRFLDPMFNTVIELLKKGNHSLEDINTYLMCKHGLERNVYMKAREAKERAEAWAKKVEKNILDKFKSTKKSEDAKLRYWTQQYKEQMENGTITEEDYEKAIDKLTKTHAKNIAKAENARDKHLEKLEEDKEVKRLEIEDEIGDKDYAGLTEVTMQKGETSNDKFTDRAKEYVETFETAYEKDDIDKLWKKINAANNESLKKSYQSGMLTKEGYEHIKSMYEFYVPLRGWDNNEAGKEYDYLSNDHMNLSPVVVKKAKGRDSKADNVLATIGFVGESTILRCNRNKMKQAFLNMAENHPTDLVTVSKQWYLYSEIFDEWVPQYPMIPENATTEEANAIFEAFEEHMQQLKKDGIAQQGKVKLSTGLHMKAAEMPEHMVKVMRNGQEYTVYVNGNPRAAQAINGLLNPDNANRLWIDKALENVKHFMAANFTSRNPAFVLSNLARDIIFAGNAVRIKEDKAYSKQYHENVHGLLFKMKTAGLLKNFDEGTLDDNVPIERYFKEFIMNGGETGFTNLNTVENYKRDINRLVNEAKNGKSLTKKTWQGFWDGVEFMNRSVEDISRFAVYMTSRQQGRTVERSIWDAKEITVNFNKKGSGDFGARWMNYAYVFFNAAIQSIANFIKLSLNNPGKMAKTLGKFAIMGFLVPAYSILSPKICSAISSMLFGDDDEEEEKDDNAYFDLPKWVRENNLVFHVPFTDHTFITIPLPHELRPFYAIGENALCALMGKEKVSDAVKNSASAFTSMVPLDFTGHDGDVLSNIMPTAVLPLWELKENKDFFGKPIYVDYDHKENQPAWKNVYRGTSPMLVEGSRIINKIGTKDDNVRGVSILQINPAVIEHLFEGYFGGMGKTINRTANTFSMLWDEDARMVRNVPVVSSFVQNADPRFSGSHVQNNYYEHKEDYEKLKSELGVYEKYRNAAKKLHDDENVKHYKQLIDDFKEEHPEYKILEKYMKKIDKARSKEKQKEDLLEAAKYLGPDAQSVVIEKAEEDKEDQSKKVLELKRELEEELKKLE